MAIKIEKKKYSTYITERRVTRSRVVLSLTLASLGTQEEKIN